VSKNTIEDIEKQLSVLKQDVDLQKKEIASLRQSKQRYKDIFENANDLIHSLDSEGRLLYANRLWRETLGYTEDEIKKMKIFDIVDAECQPKCISIFNCIMGGEQVEPTETIFVAKDGQKIMVEGRCNPKYEEGKAVELLGIFRDISERKQVEEELRMSEERYRTVVEAQTELICRWKPDYKLTFVNDAYCRYFGISRSELLGKNFMELIPEEEHEKVSRHFSSLSQEQPVLTHEHKVKLPSGMVGWQQWTNRAIFDDRGHLVEFQDVGRDITDRKQAEEALQKAHDEMEQRVKERTVELEKTHSQLLHAEKLAAIGKLSASIAHEFNNPLTGIQSVIEGIKINFVLDEQHKELIDLALSECDRVKGLIESLQNFNKPSSGVKEDVDIHSLLDNMILLVNKEFKSSHITIEKQYAPELPMVHIVTDQIKQVFLNLLTNAKDAIVGDSGRVTITTEDLNGKIVVRINNTGRCIAQDDLSHIFEPFFTTKSAVKGTGLGLSVSYGIIKGHGGDILVESTPDQRTTFSVILPLSEKRNE
jgi:PAS domain S-box-containing protein